MLLPWVADVIILVNYFFKKSFMTKKYYIEHNSDNGQKIYFYMKQKMKQGYKLHQGM